jgi:hypothetical protein
MCDGKADATMMNLAIVWAMVSPIYTWYSCLNNIKVLISANPEVSRIISLSENRYS